jgi:UDP-glucose 4-epimerase
MRNVLVNGAISPLGRRLLALLRESEGVEKVVGVEPRISSNWLEGVELVAFEPDHRALVTLLCDLEIDTVIHCGLAPDRAGECSEPTEANVIDTMRMGAAVGHPDVAVRGWVIASSSAVYPVRSYAPLLNTEASATCTDEEDPGTAFLEAEEYARDVAERAPHLNVAILRLQELAGPGANGPLAAVLAQPVVPRLLGFDPTLQFLHLEDAARGLRFAAEIELAGVYNLASEGVLRWSQVLAALDRRSAPILPLEAGPLTPLARAFRLPHVPPGLLDLLRFGHALDVRKLAAAGYKPVRDQFSCLRALG